MITRSLHLLIHPDDPLARAVLALQQTEPDCVLTVRDLTQPEVDYQALLGEIFAADTVTVW